MILGARKFGLMPDRDFEAIPYQGFSACDYQVKACLLEPGDVINLGNRAFEVMHLPEYSSGASGPCDAGKQQFFSRDVVYDVQLLDDLEDSVISEYLDSMEQLLQLQADEVRPGHYDGFARRQLSEVVCQHIYTRKAAVCPSEKQ